MQDSPTLADPREVITSDNADQLIQLAAFEMPYSGSAVAGRVLLRFSPDGSHLLASRTVQFIERFVRLWDMHTGEQTLAFSYRAGRNAPIFSPDGVALVTLNSESQLQLWDAETGDHRVWRFVFPNYADNLLRQMYVDNLTYNADGVLLAYGLDGEGIVVWNPRSGAIIARLLNYRPVASTIPLYPTSSGEILTYLDMGGQLHLHDLMRGEIVMSMQHSGANARNVTISGDGQIVAYVVSTFGGAYLEIWERDPLERRFSLQVEEVRHLALSPDGSLLAVSRPGRIDLVDSAGEMVGTVTLNGASTSRFSPDGTLLAAVNAFGDVFVFGKNR